VQRQADQTESFPQSRYLKVPLRPDSAPADHNAARNRYQHDVEGLVEHLLGHTLEHRGI